VSFGLTAYSSTLDFPFPQNSGLPTRHLSRAGGHVAILQARQELEVFCRRTMSSLKTVLWKSLANADVFQWQPPLLAALQHAPKDGFTYGRYINLLQPPFLACKRSGVPLHDFAATGSWLASLPQRFCHSQQCRTTHSAVWAGVQRPRGRGSRSCLQLGAWALPVPGGMLEQHTQRWQGVSSWCWRSEAGGS